MKKIALSLFFICATTAFSIAQDKVLFRFNPVVGETLNYLTFSEMEVGGAQSVSTTTTMKMSKKVGEKTPENTFKTITRIESIKLDADYGMGQMSYDSENVDESDMTTQMVAQQFKPLLKKDIELTYDQRNKVTSTIPSEFAAIGLSEATFNASVFPEKEVFIGESWTNSIEEKSLGISLTFTNTYSGEENGLLRVNTIAEDSSGNTKIKAEGYNLYDPKTFNVVKMSLKQDVEVEGAKISETIVTTLEK